MHEIWKKKRNGREKANKLKEKPREEGDMVVPSVDKHLQVLSNDCL